MTTEFVPAKPIKALDMTTAKLTPLTGVSEKQIAFGERQRAIQIRDAVDHLNRKIGIAYKEAFIDVLNEMLKNRNASYWIEMTGLTLTVEAHSAGFKAESDFRNANPPQSF